MGESEGGVYRDLSLEMRDGLKNIYHQISSASAAGSHNPEALFNDASIQLKEVVRETETAAMDIMEIVEKQLDLADKTASLLGTLRQKVVNAPELDLLNEYNTQLLADLTAVLTALSFQDITGQRIKKVMAALGALERNVVDLYLSSGLIIEAADRDPGKDTESLKQEAAQAVEEYKAGSKLKGPDSSGVSQAAIDDMLAQLGL